jgi:hypothetical protein
MTNEEAEALGRRALAAGFGYDSDAVPFNPAGLPRSGPPDFRDPRVMGVLVAQVRERWGDPRLYARPCNMGMWSVRAGRDPWIRSTEAAAWVAALEAAP